jgi:ATP phosphoribosyltransferase
VVRKLRSGDVDMGIVGYDMVREYGKDDEDLIVIHDALGYGECHLAVGVPTYGIFENISSISQLAAMPQWTEDRPLRVVTGYTYLGQKFLQENGLKHVQILTADGALEAAPAVSIYLEQ